MLSSKTSSSSIPICFSKKPWGLRGLCDEIDGVDAVASSSPYSTTRLAGKGWLIILLLLLLQLSAALSFENGGFSFSFAALLFARDPL
jgi:hypothetical protein